MVWVWLFVYYSFLGYLLERMFAKVTCAPKQVRKCFLLLPLCPVYGLAMTAFLALTDPGDYSALGLILRGAVLTTIVEYGVHLLYEWIFGVKFWDYSGVAGNIWGRVCLPFSAAWGLLSAWSIRYLQPLLLPLAEQTPPLVSYLLLVVLAADAVLSAALLRRYHDTELLSLRAVGRRLAG